MARMKLINFIKKSLPVFIRLGKQGKEAWDKLPPEVQDKAIEAFKDAIKKYK